MMAAALGTRPVDEAWRKLEGTLERAMKPDEKGVTHDDAMRAMTAVHDYCTGTGASATRTRQSGEGARTYQPTQGANILGQEVYDRLKEYLTKHVDDLYTDASKHMDDNLLQDYMKKWALFTQSIPAVNFIFRYLNKNWIPRAIDECKPYVFHIDVLPLVLWRDRFFDKVRGQVISAVLKMIERDRRGEVSNASWIKTIVGSVVMLSSIQEKDTKDEFQLYTTAFEKPFIEATRQYYQADSDAFLAQHTLREYMKRVETCLQEESARVQLYLHRRTEAVVIAECEQTLIVRRRDALAEEFVHLLQNDSFDDLGRAYALLSRLKDGLAALRDGFETHVRSNGMAALDSLGETAETDPALYVDAILGVHRKYSDVVVKWLKNDAGFVAALDKACREIINRNSICQKNTAKSSELLVRYCDGLLRKGSKNPEAQELEELLKNVMVVFKYIEDKDVFQKFYSKMLAKRLVNNMSALEDAEESMISKLKEACGYEYTLKLHRMFNDMQTSRDLNTEYRNQVERSASTDDGSNDAVMDMSVLVLGTSAWPLSPPSTNFAIPAEFERSLTRFQRFYQNKYSGRKLTWLFNLSKGEVKVNYCRGTKTGYTFQVSMYQMGVLLLFNNATRYAFAELEQATQIAPEVLKQILAILLKARVLLSDAEEPDITSTFDLNMDFKSKKVKVNLNMPLKTEQKVEQEETHRHVQEDRKMLIQAAIVRIMKTRKVSKYVNLMNEVITQLQSRFKPSVQDIKKCIDILIEKEYIARNEEAKDTFNYLA